MTPELATATLHVDYDTIVELVEPGSTVLDLGCGDGVLLSRLIERKQVRGCGVEIDSREAIRALGRGVSVVQADIDEGLVDFGDGRFDYAILNRTLQVVRRPQFVVREMLRVSRHAIVSFPNMGYWRVRMQLFFQGHQPRTPTIPFEWFNTPNIHLCTIKDFRRFCRDEGITIEREIPIRRTAARQGRVLHWWPNLTAEEGIFVITKR